MNSDESTHAIRWQFWIGILFAAWVLVAGVLVLVQFLSDQKAYLVGDEAYRRADCRAAVAHFDELLGKTRLFAVGGHLARAKTQQLECLHLQAAARRYPEGELCAAYASIQDAAGEAIIDWLPMFYYTCGLEYENGIRYESATRMYTRFQAAYPDHTLAPDVEEAFARAMIGKARSAGSRPLGAPDPAGEIGGRSVIVAIQNGSSHRVRIAFSGPQALVEDLGACLTCETRWTEPAICSKEGPTGLYKLKPGRYDVVLESLSDSSLDPLKGAWTLHAGQRYGSCFVVVNSLR